MREPAPEPEPRRSPIEETELYRVLGPERLARIRPRARLGRFEEGEYLYFEGQPAAHVWAVASGTVRTLRGTAGGRITTLETLHRGDLFGMAALAGEAEYPEACQAVTAAEAWSVPSGLLASDIGSDPELGRALLGIVAARLRNAHHRLCSFAHDTVTARMAQALLETEPGERIETTRRLLGESAGTTVETAIRVLRRFERAGWLEGGVGWVRVLDADALAAIARGKTPGDPL